MFSRKLLERERKRLADEQAARAQAERRAVELSETLAKYQADNDKYQQGNDDIVLFIVVY